MFRLALRAGKVADVPVFEMLDESDNVRRGYMEEADLDRLLEHLPPHLHALIVTAFFTGWRTHSELLTRERRHLRDGWLTLEPGEAKSKEARTFPVNAIPRLRAALDEQVARVEAMERAQSRVIPWLFIGPTGERIRDFRTAWQRACVKAGIPDKLVHDFRRSAVNSLNNAGVSIKTAMGLVGHKTMSVYNRYGIHDKKNLLAGAAKLADYFDQRETVASKLTPIQRAS